MKKSSEEIPLADNLDKKNLSLIVAILFFLISFFSIITFNVITENSELKNKKEEITIQLLPNNLDNNEPNLHDETLEKKYTKIMSILKGTKGISNITKITGDNLKNWLKEWKYEGDPSKYVEGILMQISALKNGSFAIDPLFDKLRKIHPNTYFYQKSKHLDDVGLLNIFFKIFMLLFSVLLVICFTILISVTTRSAVVMHKDIVRTLQLMGAKKTYIQGIYQKQIFKTTLMGLFIGLIMCIAFLYIFNALLALFKTGLPKVDIFSTLNIQIMCFIFAGFTGLSSFSSKRIITKSIQEANF